MLVPERKIFWQPIFKPEFYNWSFIHSSFIIKALRAPGFLPRRCDANSDLCRGLSSVSSPGDIRLSRSNDAYVFSIIGLAITSLSLFRMNQYVMETA